MAAGPGGDSANSCPLSAWPSFGECPSGAHQGERRRLIGAWPAPRMRARRSTRSYCESDRRSRWCSSEAAPLRMTSRRQRRKAAAHHRRDVAELPAEAAREFEFAGSVSKLAYTREQAAEALGISLATLDR